MKAGKIRKSKPHSNSVIFRLPPEQRKLLDHWLFNRNYSYKAAIAKALKQFKVTIHPASISLYYREIQRQRAFDQITGSVKYADGVIKAFEKHPAGKNFEAILNIVGQMTFDSAMESQEDSKKPFDIKALRDRLQLFLNTRKDDREERETALEREKWEFDVVRVVERHHKELEAISKDESLDEEKRLRAIRCRIFGKNLP